MGYPVNPLDVVANGTRHVHAVWEGASYLGGAGGAVVELRTPDSPVLSPGDTQHLLWYDGAAAPVMAGGVHANVYNNVWGTAFPQWYDADARFRFELELTPPACC